jgi:hypothetical protein
MATHSVDVLIKARDHASKQFGAVGKSALSMGSMIKRAAAIAATYITVRGVVNFTKSSLESYARQEAASVSLAKALELLNKKAELPMMEKFASSIQSVTEYGDEAVLEIMQLGASIGKLSGLELQRATKATIGLSKAYGIDLKASMLLVGKAAAGNTSAMTRYGIQLDEGLSAAEKFNEVLKIGEKNFKLAEAATNTYAGKVTQMKNAIGDVKEAIGQQLMPIFKTSAERIKEWAEKNQERIGGWANKTVSSILLVKDILQAVVDFMKKDWKTGLEFATDSALAVFERFGKASGILFEKIASDLADAFSDQKIKKAAGWYAEQQLMEKILQKRGYGNGLFGPQPTDAEVKSARAEARKTISQLGPTYASDAMPTGNSKSWEQVFQEIKSMPLRQVPMPPDLKSGFVSAWATFLERINPSVYNPKSNPADFLAAARNNQKNKMDAVLAAVNTGGAYGILQSYFNRMPDLAGITSGGKMQNWSPFESRFMTTAPAGRIDPTVEVAKNTAEQKKQLAVSNKHLQKIAENTGNGNVTYYPTVTL